MKDGGNVMVKMKAVRLYGQRAGWNVDIPEQVLSEIESTVSDFVTPMKYQHTTRSMRLVTVSRLPKRMYCFVVWVIGSRGDMHCSVVCGRVNNRETTGIRTVSCSKMDKNQWGDSPFGGSRDWYKELTDNHWDIRDIHECGDRRK